jgi:hypothetical protein
LPAALAGLVITLAIAPAPAAADEPREKPSAPRPGNHRGSLGDAQDSTTNPPAAPAPGDSNRASVRRYVESIDPSSWLRRFGKVESRERR